jgi:hypothetical protein
MTDLTFHKNTETSIIHLRPFRGAMCHLDSLKTLITYPPDQLAVPSPVVGIIRPLLSTLHGLGAASNLQAIDELATSRKTACFSPTTSEERYRVGVVVWCILTAEVFSLAGKFRRTLPAVRCHFKRAAMKLGEATSFKPSISTPSSSISEKAPRA